MGSQIIQSRSRCWEVDTMNGVPIYSKSKSLLLLHLIVVIVISMQSISIDSWSWSHRHHLMVMVSSSSTHIIVINSWSWSHHHQLMVMASSPSPHGHGLIAITSWCKSVLYYPLVDWFKNFKMKVFQIRWKNQQTVTNLSLNLIKTYPMCTIHEILSWTPCFVRSSQGWKTMWINHFVLIFNHSFMNYLFCIYSHLTFSMCTL